MTTQPRDDFNKLASSTLDGIREARQQEDLPADLIDALEEAAVLLITDLTISRASNPPKDQP